jgi:hypothetical protein
MTDRKKVDIAIFAASKEPEAENLRQVVICPTFQKVGKKVVIKIRDYVQVKKDSQSVADRRFRLCL